MKTATGNNEALPKTNESMGKSTYQETKYRWAVSTVSGLVSSETDPCQDTETKTGVARNPK